MQTRSKILFFVVFVCLLLSLAGGGRRRNGGARDNHVGRDRQRLAVRLRRLRTDNPAHSPIRPSSAALLPPDDDDDNEDRFRSAPRDLCEIALARHEEQLAAQPFSRLSAQPPAPDQPLYRTLRILLI